MSPSLKDHEAGPRLYGRVPNVASPLLSSNLAACYSVCVWNARALFHHKQDVRRKKCCKVAELCSKHAIVGLLETHGSEIELRKSLDMIKSHILMGVSQCKSNNGKRVGGVATLVDRRLLPGSPEDPTYRPNQNCTTLVPGRAVRVALLEGSKTFACTFVHNSDFSLDNMRAVEVSIRADSAAANADPTNFAGLCLGSQPPTP